MAKAIFNRKFDATDTTKGVSIRVQPSDRPQTLPRWVIDLAVEKGAAKIVDPKTKKNDIPAETPDP